VRTEDRISAAARSHGRLRASDSDRERVVDMLKTAFVQGRLTQHEFEARVGQTLIARTFGDLTALTADIPAWSIPRRARKPAKPPVQPVHAVVKAVACAFIALAAVGIAGMPGAWTMPAPPSMSMLACRSFDAWQSPTTRDVASLSVAINFARQGTDYPLANNLASLQQAYLRYMYLGDLKQSPGDRQVTAATNQMKADTALVAADCQLAGN
jgi:hypothetical protein